MQISIRFLNGISRWKGKESSAAWASLKMISTTEKILRRVCAVYTEKQKRGQGVAGALLNYVCSDMKSKGISTLYLVTNHTGFYERYGWEFLCLVQGEGESEPSRMYVHK